jgi:hypothetical protein
VIRRHHIIKDRETEPFVRLEKPAHVAAPIANSKDVEVQALSSLQTS